MAGAIDQRRLEVDQREARQHAGLQRRLEALLDAGNEFARDRTAGDGVLEGEAGTRLLRLKHQLDAGELTGAAGLDRTSVVYGKSGSVRVDRGGRRIIKK